MTAYLLIDHLDKSFARGSRQTDVLCDITLGIEMGEFVSIIGHSGCGKSTLLNVVAGLTPATRGGGAIEGSRGDEHRASSGASSARRGGGFPQA